jgi:hypothetical protein
MVANIRRCIRNTQAQMVVVPAGKEGVLLQEFLQMGLVAIGWPQLGDLTSIETQEMLEQLLVKSLFNEVASPEHLPGVREQLLSFLFAVAEGDWVVTVDRAQDVAYVGKLTGELRFLDNTFLESAGEYFQNFRLVDWKYTARRKDFASETCSNLFRVSENIRFLPISCKHDILCCCIERSNLDLTPQEVRTLQDVLFGFQRYQFFASVYKDEALDLVRESLYIIYCPVSGQFAPVEFVGYVNASNDHIDWSGYGYYPDDDDLFERNSALNWDSARECVRKILKSKFKENVELGRRFIKWGEELFGKHSMRNHDSSMQRFITLNAKLEQSVVESTKTSIYRRTSTAIDISPVQTNPVVLETDEVARPRTGGQKRRKSAAERKAIELHAMYEATRFFEKLGFSVIDTSANHPYDLLCKKENDLAYVEVKGTTGSGDSILLTSGEVEHARIHRDKTVLYILFSIEVADEGMEPLASGGVERVFWKWAPEDNQLTPKSYSCDVSTKE